MIAAKLILTNLKFMINALNNVIMFISQSRGVTELRNIFVTTDVCLSIFIEIWCTPCNHFNISIPIYLKHMQLFKI